MVGWKVEVEVVPRVDIFTVWRSCVSASVYHILNLSFRGKTSTLEAGIYAREFMNKVYLGFRERTLYRGAVS